VPTPGSLGSGTLAPGSPGLTEQPIRVSVKQCEMASCAGGASLAYSNPFRLQNGVYDMRWTWAPPGPYCAPERIRLQPDPYDVDEVTTVLGPFVPPDTLPPSGVKSVRIFQSENPDGPGTWRLLTNGCGDFTAEFFFSGL
jgi:hypothetical protein